MKKGTKKQAVVIYQAKNGAIALQTDAARETIWITQKQMGALVMQLLQ
ncbi:hypothetical protein HY416_01685 [Candidatus Kaiserbacteria bacterium]|nr:hypothetical protein [Candidatus Kaiserbacteria bacterium]